MDDEFEKELEIIRKRKLEELSMSDNTGEWPGAPVNISDNEFSEFIGKYPYVIVDCWAPWCGPCRMLGPIIDELAKDYQGQIVFGKLNTDENQVTASAHGIMSIPTLLFFKDGQMVDRITGAMPREVLEPKVKEHL